MVNGTSLENAIFDPVPTEFFRDNTEWKNEVMISSEAGETVVVGGLTVVPQLEVKEVVLETSLPLAVIKENSDGGLVYSLRIQKQAGIISLPVELQITAPSGYTITNLPDGWAVSPDQGNYIWGGEIKKTTDFQLEFIKN